MSYTHQPIGVNHACFKIIATRHEIPSWQFRGHGSRFECESAWRLVVVDSVMGRPETGSCETVILEETVTGDRRRNGVSHLQLWGDQRPGVLLLGIGRWLINRYKNI